MRTLTTFVRGAVALGALGGAACASQGASVPPREPAGLPSASVQLRPPSAMPRDFVWRQRVTVAYGEREPRSFDAVLQKRGDRLSLVGLTPINTVTFVVEQAGLDVTFDNRTGEPLPFDGRHIMQDFQRVYFPWLNGESADGTRKGVVLGEQVSEQVADGQVVVRRFDRPQRQPVTVRFEGLRGVGRPPQRVVLENQRYGYRLVIETSANE